jgi:lipoate-protein ligase A
MFNSEIENVVAALNVSEEKIKSKGIKSIRSRVANITEFLDHDMTMEEFKTQLLQHLFDVEDIKDVPKYKLTDDDWEKIHEISKARYQNWDWNFGKSPKFDIRKSHKFPAGLVDVRMDVSKGQIKSCKIYGDFFGVGDVTVIEEALIDTRYQKEAIEKALEEIDVPHYLGKISKEDLIDLIY